jgi:aminomethyltransferase
LAFRKQESVIPRPGMAVLPAGEVTSGTMSPCLGVGIGMAYVPAASADPGGELTIDVRGRPHRARVAAKPLYVKETVA